MSDAYESERSEGIAGFLAARSLRFWIASAAVLVLFIVLLWMWARFGLVRVRYDVGAGVDRGRIEARAYDVGRRQVADEDAFTTVFGLALVPRSTRYVQVTSGGAETIAPLGRIPRFGAGHLDVRVEAQRAVDKLGTQLDGCVFSTESGTYNYSCVNAHAIRQYVRPRDSAWKNETVQTFFPKQTVKVRPYGGGLVGIVDLTTGAEPAAQLFYAEPGNGAPRTVPVPPELVRGGVAYLNIATDATNRRNPSFVVYNVKTGKIARYPGFGPDKEPVLYQRTVAFDDTAFLTQCVLRGQAIYCYVGLRGNAPDSEEEDSARGKAGPAAVQVFGTGEPHTYQAPSVFGVEKFYASAKGLYVQADGYLYEIGLEGDGMRLGLISPPVSAVAAGTDLYWNTAAGVYRYDPVTRSAALVFQVSNLQMSDMTARGDDLVFNAFVKGDQQSQLQTYRLTDQPQQGMRWEDKLPYSTQRELPIVAMDYTAGRLYIQLRTATVPGPDGRVEVDKDSFDAARSEVLKALTADGFDTASLAIQFTA